MLTVYACVVCVSFPSGDGHLLAPRPRDVLYRSGVRLTALSETPRSGRWHSTSDTSVDIGAVVSGSPLHRYIVVMLRAALLLGVDGVDLLSADTAAAVDAALVAGGASAVATAELDWGMLEAVARQQGELHAVGQPHVSADRRLWIRWADAPATFKKDFDYITPKQTQALARVSDASAMHHRTAEAKLLNEFKRHVDSTYSAGTWNVGIWPGQGMTVHVSDDPHPLFLHAIAIRTLIHRSRGAHSCIVDGFWRWSH